MDAFAQAVAVELQNPQAALCLYGKLAEEGNASAHINMGTIFYNTQNYTDAEAHYRAAIALDPQYALAYFNLANVLDETGRTADAVAMYMQTVKLWPDYADAHFNLALVLTRQGASVRALKHWRAYLKWDRQGPWNAQATKTIKLIHHSTGLKIARTNSEPNRTPERAKLELV